jgi:hypothetical protein
LGVMILSEPLEFKYTAQELRELNRKWKELFLILQSGLNI